jgi:hypothetical protein
MTHTEKAVKPRLIDRLLIAKKDKHGSKENVKEKRNKKPKPRIGLIKRKLRI